ncbi:MAG: hypothetical protein ACKOKC_01775 [Chthoniobacterales bacterium]
MPHPEDQPAPKVASELPSYSLEEEEAPAGWRRWLRGRRLIVLCSVVALAAIAIFSAKPLYREAKARRALSIAEQAGLAIDRGDSAEASRLLRQAALMAFQDKRVAARVTLHAARAGDMASVAELGKKLTEGDSSAEETLVFGEMSLAARRVDEAARASDALPADLSVEENARATALRAGILQARQNPDEARNLLRAAIEQTPGESSDRLRIMLASLLLAERNEAASKNAEELLEQAAKNQGEEGAAALRLLCANRAGLTAEAQHDLAKTAERLRSHPSSNEEDEVYLARLAISADPNRTEEVARDLVTRLTAKQSADIDTRVAAARLLVGANRLNEVLELVTEEEASTHAGALMARLDALSGLKDWEQTSTLIEKNKGGTLPDTLYHLFRARMALERGDTQAAEDEKRVLRQVMGFAEAPHVLFAARYAETVGWKPEALAAWRILAANEGARPDALRAQLRNLPPDAPASEGLGITEELLQIRPDDPSAQLSAVYFRLMAGKDTETSAETAEKFLAADPESADLRRVAALRRLRTGKPADGLNIWPGDGDENRWRALHVALLRASGQTRAAERAAEDVGTESLSPEDKDLLSGKSGE